LDEPAPSIQPLGAIDKADQLVSTASEKLALVITASQLIALTQNNKEDRVRRFSYDQIHRLLIQQKRPWLTIATAFLVPGIISSILATLALTSGPDGGNVLWTICAAITLLSLILAGYYTQHRITRLSFHGHNDWISEELKITGNKRKIERFINRLCRAIELSHETDWRQYKEQTANL